MTATSSKDKSDFPIITDAETPTDTHARKKTPSSAEISIKSIMGEVVNTVRRRFVTLPGIQTVPENTPDSTPPTPLIITSLDRNNLLTKYAVDTVHLVRRSDRTYSEMTVVEYNAEHNLITFAFYDSAKGITSLKQTSLYDADQVCKPLSEQASERTPKQIYQVGDTLYHLVSSDILDKEDFITEKEILAATPSGRFYQIPKNRESTTWIFHQQIDHNMQAAMKAGDQNEDGPTLYEETRDKNNILYSMIYFDQESNQYQITIEVIASKEMSKIPTGTLDKRLAYIIFSKVKNSQMYLKEPFSLKEYHVSLKRFLNKMKSNIKKNAQHHHDQLDFNLDDIPEDTIDPNEIIDY